MSAKSFYTWLFFLLPLWDFAIYPFDGPDLMIWVSLGQQILSSGLFVPPENFSLTLIQYPIYPSWGLAVVYAFIYRLGTDGLMGIKFLVLAHELVIICLLWIIYRKSLREQLPGDGALRAVILVGIYGFGYLLIPRPALVAYVPFIILYYLVESPHPFRKQEYFIIYFVTAIWANIHASAILIALLFTWKFGAHILFTRERFLLWKNYFTGLIISLLAIHSTPWGAKIWNYYFLTRHISKIRMIGEWQPPWSLNFPATEIIYFLLLLYLIYFFSKKIYHQKNLQPLTTAIIPLALFGLTATRHLPWLFLAIIPFFCEQQKIAHDFSKTCVARNDRQAPTSALNFWVIIFFLVLIMTVNPLITPKWISDLDQQWTNLTLENRLPMREFSYLEQHHYHKSPIFSHLGYHGMAQLLLGSKVLFDERNIIFPESAFQDYIKIMAADAAWEQILDHYQIEIVLLNCAKKIPLCKKIKFSPHWDIISSGPLFLLAIAKRSGPADK